MKTLINILTLISFSLSLSVYAQSNLLYDQQVLTAEEKDQADVYIHQGLENERYKENCVDDSGQIKEECQASEAGFKSKFGQNLEVMMPVVSQMYSLFALQGTGKIKYNVSNKGNTAQDKIKDTSAGNGEAKKEVKEQTDYCGLIPMVSETTATVMNQMRNQRAQDNISQGTGGIGQQAEAFEAMAQTQDNLAETSTWQAGGWATTAACYVTLMATGKINLDGKNKTSPIVKLSAATFLGTFYGLKVKAHKDRAQAYRDLGADFPKAGDCNPHTETTCFCNEKTSQQADPTNYQKYCALKGLHSSAPGAISCVTKDFKPDPACACKNSNSCVQATIANVGAQIGLPASVINGQLKALRPFSSGFGSGTLGAGTNGNLAFAKRYLKKADTPKANLKNTDQVKIAKELIKNGIPKKAAALASVTKGSNSSPFSSNARFGRSSLRRSNSQRKAFTKKPQFKRGGTVKTVKGSSRRSRRSKRGGGAKAVEIQDFASQAEKQAVNNMISKDTSRPIFDIITYRYKTSAWREFKDQIQKELKESDE